MSQPEKQTITLHNLPNITRNKSNKTIKFGHLIKRQKYFFSKNIQKRRQGDKLQSIFLKKCFILGKNEWSAA